MTAKRLNKDVQYVDVTLTNVAITTKSWMGAYYAPFVSYPSEAQGKTVLSITLGKWTGASGIIVPYVEDSTKYGFMSGVSQTVNSVVVRIAYV